MAEPQYFLRFVRRMDNQVSAHDTRLDSDRAAKILWDAVEKDKTTQEIWLGSGSVDGQDLDLVLLWKR